MSHRSTIWGALSALQTHPPPHSHRMHRHCPLAHHHRLRGILQCHQCSPLWVVCIMEVMAAGEVAVVEVTVVVLRSSHHRHRQRLVVLARAGSFKTTVTSCFIPTFVSPVLQVLIASTVCSTCAQQTHTVPSKERQTKASAKNVRRMLLQWKDRQTSNRVFVQRITFWITRPLRVICVRSGPTARKAACRCTSFPSNLATGAGDEMSRTWCVVLVALQQRKRVAKEVQLELLNIARAHWLGHTVNYVRIIFCTTPIRRDIIGTARKTNASHVPIKMAYSR
jgi:hypothetical protein